MTVAVLFGPVEEAQQLTPVLPHKTAEFAGSDALGVPAPVGFDAPPQIRAAPGTETVAFGCLPKEAQHQRELPEPAARVGAAVA